MYRILLVSFFCFFFCCLSHQTFQQVEISKNEYQTTKRLPFIANTCDRKAVFSNNILERNLIIRIWENGEFRNVFLNNEPFDIIEDLRIYQSHDYTWYISFIPLFSGYYCDQYHLTGYLLYLDPNSKEKLNAKLEKDRTKTTGSNGPIKAFREYSLIDEKILSQKIKELREKKQERGYSKHKEQFYKPKIWDSKSKSELVYIPNDQLIDYCLEFPYECVNDQNYIQEIRSRTTANAKLNLNPTNFSNLLLEKINTTKDKTYFGCYCRKNSDFFIYSQCPIDRYGLDALCKKKTDCLEERNAEKERQCFKTFKEDLSILLKTKESKDKIHQEKENFERMIFYTKKLWALEVLKDITQ